MNPFLVVDQADLTRSCTVKSDSWSNKRMCANRLSDHNNADLCTDKICRLSHDILILFVHSFVHRIFNWPRCKKTFYCQAALVLLLKTYTDNSYICHVS